jgi:hypothetical protein
MDIYPFEGEVENTVLDRLVNRARRMVAKHRRNGVWDGDDELRVEREDVGLAMGFGV